MLVKYMDRFGSDAYVDPSEIVYVVRNLKSKSMADVEVIFKSGARGFLAVDEEQLETIMRTAVPVEEVTGPDDLPFE